MKQNFKKNSIREMCPLFTTGTAEFVPVITISGTSIPERINLLAQPWPSLGPLDQPWKSTLGYPLQVQIIMITQPFNFAKFVGMLIFKTNSKTYTRTERLDGREPFTSKRRLLLALHYTVLQL